MSLCACLVVAVTLQEDQWLELSLPMIIMMTIVISVLSFAVIVICALVCYYRRRMKAITGEI